MRREETQHEIEPLVEQVLQEVEEQLAKNEQIQEYRVVAERAKEHPRLNELIESIKAEQKNAVQFAHYGKPTAESEAIKKADAFTQAFDEHPLVVQYREHLVEANDLVQHLFTLIEEEVNQALQTEIQDRLAQEEKKE